MAAGKLKLYVECQECLGLGATPNPAYEEWEASEITRRRLDPLRYASNDDIDWRNSGTWPDQPCEACCGRGMVPYLGPMPEGN